MSKQDILDYFRDINHAYNDSTRLDTLSRMLDELIEDAASTWHRVEDGLPKEAGEYIVAYHPCWWNDVKTSVTEIGIDTFRGKTSWAKRKFQRVTHWMEKPEPPKEDT